MENDKDNAQGLLPVEIPLPEKSPADVPEEIVKLKKRGRPKGSPNKKKVVEANLEVEEKVIPSATKNNKLLVTIDFTPQEVLYYDSEGKDLFFDESPEKFLKLEEEVWKALRRDNQQRYLVTCALHIDAKKRTESPDLFGSITVEDRGASATNRLKVRGKKKGLHYAWKRTDELRSAMYDGYKVARHDGLETFRGKGDQVHKVSAGGQDEMVLMETSEKAAQAKLEEVGGKSRKRAEGAVTKAVEEMRKAGGKPFIPDERGKDAQNWSPIKRD